VSRYPLAIAAAAFAIGGTYYLAPGLLEIRPGGSLLSSPTSAGLPLIQTAEAAEKAVDDPRLLHWQSEGWQTNFSKLEIDPASVLSGGPPRDGIPSIDDPQFIPVADEGEIPDREPVVSVVVNGDARAYPLRIMMWHEIVNDEVGGVPLAVTYCPLCNASIVFEATLDGTPLEFGTTGKLRNSDLIMYDRRTQSWWQQFSGEAIAGEYAGRSLKMLPSRLDSWARFKQEHPDGKVLIPSNPEMRAYWRNPYANYDSAAAPFLFKGTLPVGIHAMERVVLVRGDDPFAIALPLLEKEGEIREGDKVLRWEAGQASALDTASIAEGRDVGNVTVERMVDGNPVPVVHDVTFAFVVNAFEPTLIIRTE
jgi:hypothetical protein